ncbi:MAG: glutamine-hydrolyzing carbamoyl-phosphate synthase small subunit [Nitrosopumilus sp.]|uniref:glutamine-hydrolyzing carbamoyl-phosphate synthase small subunit n=1 Tax=Nitrosopumilus sp. TaxID=2024843 RepID=UPI002470F8C6|nr:glutamine-hydrolyzing carbamoyl-phosphate synthase small subunit [Nitrosopumilus sp.]MDH5432144.1 glutamine-hydrolyzing carbamoyl-phosphate synthase small subunit [Nitrosopumilus sp.]MDH5665566.1 glutamine-hydrolyzing carbamoyl-phosphate synthase small subunit [Nitrosopumilus sp.]MDH5696913.1 glutamine-hydrolyzing carbamoyl-phosphate synthase small subunit [Nitrosopumilus sp.]
MIFNDGTVLDGQGFGYSTTVFGEIVFNTGMVGYTEALTDPSYNGQILTLTYPLVGNYGVPDPSVKDDNGIPKFFESDKIQIRGLVVHELSLTASHWNLTMTLDEWMNDEKVPGISGIDTRELTKKLRTGGVMMAALVVSDTEIDVESIRKQLVSAKHYDSEQFMDAVSTKEEQIFGNDEKSVVVVDTGAKNAILRNVLELGYKAILVPWNTPYEKIMSYNPDGVVLSSGPGDPQKCPDTIDTAKKLIANNVPTLGICLGAQIIGIAGNTETYKLKYGHRGQNKSCINLENNQVYVTSQNHGYGITPESIEKSDFKLWFTNADDKTVEGIKHKKQNCIAVQFHPEAAPGPFDCKFVFEELKQLMEK